MTYLIPLILLVVVIFILELFLDRYWVKPIIITIIAAILVPLIVLIDYKSQVSDIEVWSGSITEIGHKEEWDEYHPPVTYTETYTDSKGKTRTRIKTKPGHWEHHYAQNWICTSDGGTISVDKSPDGKEFSDRWPNTTEELKQFWEVGDPTASTHVYDNLVQASYSIYKHNDINLKDYPGLPKYPDVVRANIYVDRFVGNIPGKDKALEKLAEWNTELNKFVPDPEKPGEKRSWKQVNLIFVNLGDVSEDYAYALQDYWENGNKNDFIIAFGFADENIKWIYPFSWADTEGSEMLKIQVRDYMRWYARIDNEEDMAKIIDNVGILTAKYFERKQMAEFNYLKIPTSLTAMIIIWILVIILGGCSFFIREDTIRYYF